MYAVPETNIVLTEGVDDVWVNLENQEQFIVAYKATSKNDQVSSVSDISCGPCNAHPQIDQKLAKDESLLIGTSQVTNNSQPANQLGPQSQQEQYHDQD